MARRQHEVRDVTHLATWQPRDIELEPGILAKQALVLLPENLASVGSVVGNSGIATHSVLSHIHFIEAQEGLAQPPDGIVRTISADPNRPLVLLSENVARFFVRNGRDTRKQAIQDATLYATALGAASFMLRTTRMSDVRPVIDETLWAQSEARDPATRSSHRFAAGVMSALGRGIDVKSVQFSGNSVPASHVVAMHDPLTPVDLRVIAARGLSG